MSEYEWIDWPIDICTQFWQEDPRETNSETELITELQAWIGGVTTHDHLSQLHRRATTIQRYWRGYRDRKRYEIMRVERKRHSMATRIQLYWRKYRMTKRHVTISLERKQILTAVRIQSYWRSYRIRKTILDHGSHRLLSSLHMSSAKKLNINFDPQWLDDPEYSMIFIDAAITIQTWFRSIMFCRRLSSLHIHARTIQRYWRGYWSRKTRLNYSEYRRWFLCLCNKQIGNFEENTDKFERDESQLVYDFDYSWYETAELSSFFIEAVTKIQAWFRGESTRKRLRRLHCIATTIQSHWRGYRVKKWYHALRAERRNRMAIRIQSFWRGYWSRKTYGDYWKMKSWLTDVCEKNKECLENMKKFKENELEQFNEILEMESFQWILFILFKSHHLLGTKQRPGVYTTVDRSRRKVPIEQMLKCFEYRFYKPLIKMQKRENFDGENSSMICRGTCFERCEHALRQYRNQLKNGKLSLRRSSPYDAEEKRISAVDRLAHLLVRLERKMLLLLRDRT